VIEISHIGRRALETVEQENRRVRSVLHEHLFTMPPSEFEHFIGELLESQGYRNVQVTGRSSDGGVDIIVDNVLGLGLVRILVQVKRWKQNIPVKIIRELRGCLDPGSHGVVITTSGFTKAAKSAAEEPGRTPIWLITGEQVVDMLIEAGLGVRKRRLLLLEIEEATGVVSPRENEVHRPFEHQPRISHTPSGHQITRSIREHFVGERTALLPVFSVLAGAVLRESTDVDYFAIKRHIVFVVGDEQESQVVMLVTVQAKRLELRLRLPSSMNYGDRLQPCADKAWKNLVHRVYLTLPNEIDSELRGWLNLAINNPLPA
jgi:hypothetical protein